MKKTILMFAAAFMLAACSDSENKKDDTNNSTQETSAPKDPEVQKGLDLVARSGCFQCHKVNETFNGPAYEAIAARYADDPKVIDTLAGKVIKGGSGRWGTIPMTPHPDIAMDDARLMVKYVLSLK